jgi:hypothetical protein
MSEHVRTYTPGFGVPICSDTFWDGSTEWSRLMQPAKGFDHLGKEDLSLSCQQNGGKLTERLEQQCMPALCYFDGSWSWNCNVQLVAAKTPAAALMCSFKVNCLRIPCNGAVAEMECDPQHWVPSSLDQSAEAPKRRIWSTWKLKWYDITKVDIRTWWVHAMTLIKRGSLGQIYAVNPTIAPPFSSFHSHTCHQWLQWQTTGKKDEKGKTWHIKASVKCCNKDLLRAKPFSRILLFQLLDAWRSKRIWDQRWDMVRPWDTRTARSSYMLPLYLFGISEGNTKCPQLQAAVPQC